ncbi:MAG: hypothetical protein QM773_03475 [Hyphomonadaceae bacterium]
MAVTQVQGAPPGESWMKSIAAPAAAGALGIVAAVVGVSVLGSPSETSAPAGMAPSAAVAPSEPPQAGSALPGVAFDQPTPGNVKMGMEIVVKFKDDAKVKDIIDAFWRDQASARTKFEAWKASRPEFANLKLDRVTYSNELVLVHDGSGAADARLPAMREIAKKLGSVADISYAEPNMTAQPGGQ